MATSKSQFFFLNGWNLLNRIEGEPLFFFFLPPWIGKKENHLIFHFLWEFSPSRSSSVATIENANKQRASAAQVVDGRQEKVWSRIQVEFQKKKKKSCQLIQKKSKNDTVKRFDHRTLQSPHYNTLVVVHSGRHPKTCPCVCQSHRRRNHFHFPPLPEDFVKLEKKGKSFCSKYCRRILIFTTPVTRWNRQKYRFLSTAFGRAMKSFKFYQYQPPFTREKLNSTCFLFYYKKVRKFLYSGVVAGWLI